MKRRRDVEQALSRHYTAKMGGNVWACYDSQRRAYSIRGDNLPSHPDLIGMYPNGWSLLDYITPAEAQRIAQAQ
jgi:hypothetical protein